MNRPIIAVPIGDRRESVPKSLSKPLPILRFLPVQKSW